MDKPVVRETYLDIIKGIAMLIVVMQHVGGRLNEGLTFLCKVDVPLFFIVSGYLAMKSNIDFRQDFVKKTKRVALPFVAALLFAAVWYDLSIATVVTDIGKCGYWFLQCLFLFFVMFYGIVKISNSRRWNHKSLIIISIIVEAALLALSKYAPASVDNIMGISYMARYFPSFMMGAIVRKYSLMRLGKLTGSVLLVVTCIAFTYKGSSTNVSFLLHVAGYASASLLLFFCIKSVENELPGLIKKLFCMIGKNSLSIYIIHFYFVTHIPSATGLFALDIVFVLCVSLVIVLLSIALQRLFSTTTYLSKVL